MQVALAEVIHLAAEIVTPWLRHHPHDSLVTVRGVDLVVRELAEGGIFKDSIRLTVVVSPSRKLDGVSVDAKGTHSWRARNACMHQLAAMVSSVYGR